MSFLRELERELTTVGVPLGRRERILAEFADHLHESPQANLGEPRALARQFADELGTSLARESAFRAFSVLAGIGLALAVVWLAGTGVRRLAFHGAQHSATPAWAPLLLLLAALGAQVSLAAGGLALLRALRLRGEHVINRAEATVLARRSAVALLGGALALVSLPVWALAFPHAGGSAWHGFAWAVTGVGLAVIAATLPALARSLRLQPTPDGPSADLTYD
ncbi:MAG: hypothetical protein ACRDKL_07730, partial [Solirubrobacteraceae bacterium]